MEIKKDKLIQALKKAAQESEPIARFLKEWGDDLGPAPLTSSSRIDLAFGGEEGLGPEEDEVKQKEGKFVPVLLKAFLFNDKMAAWEVEIQDKDLQEAAERTSKFPHATMWSLVKPQKAENLRQMADEGQAERAELKEPISVRGSVHVRELGPGHMGSDPTYSV